MKSKCILLFGILTLVVFAGPAFSEAIISWGNSSGGTAFDSVLNNIPSGNDFIKVSSFASNALALRSDGTYLAWGNNYGDMLDVPVGITFRDVSFDYGYALGIVPEPCTVLLVSLGGLFLRRKD